MTDLCVVIITLAILAAVALPALAGKDRAFSIRTQCANQLRQIGVAVTAYAHDNSGYVLSAWWEDWAAPEYTPYGTYTNSQGSDPRGPAAFDQRILLVVLTNLSKFVYLAPSMTNGVSQIWRCPSVSGSGLPAYDAGQQHWLIGYAYMGGITWWHDAVGDSLPSLSPVNLGSSKPYWVLASDLVVD